jgi:transposase
VAALDELGRVVGVEEFANNASGHQALLLWTQAQAQVRVIGIAGTGNFGAGLARFLLEASADVKEVPAFLSYRERKRNPAKGKSELADAVAIARVVASGDGLSSPRHTEINVDLKLLSDHRDQLVRARTRLINRTHKDLVVSHPGYERRIPKLTSKKSQAATIALLRGDRSVRANLIRERVAELRRLDNRVASLEKEIAAKVQEIGHHAHRAQGHRFRAGGQDSRRSRRSRSHPVEGILCHAHGDRAPRGIVGRHQGTASTAEATASSTTRCTWWPAHACDTTTTPRHTSPGGSWKESPTRRP